MKAEMSSLTSEVKKNDALLAAIKQEVGYFIIAIFATLTSSDQL